MNELAKKKFGNKNMECFLQVAIFLRKNYVM